MMITDFKIFENGLSRDNFNKVQDIIQGHIRGHPPKIKDWEFVRDCGITSNYKYNGWVWKIFFFYSNDKSGYKICLENGIHKMTNQYIYPCTKNYSKLDKIMKELGPDSGYYITVKLMSDNNTCFFDLNKLCREFMIDNPYDHEEEVLLFADKTMINKEDIIDYGEINKEQIKYQTFNKKEWENG